MKTYVSILLFAIFLGPEVRSEAIKPLNEAIPIDRNVDSEKWIRLVKEFYKCRFPERTISSEQLVTQMANLVKEEDEIVRSFHTTNPDFDLRKKGLQPLFKAYYFLKAQGINGGVSDLEIDVQSGNLIKNVNSEISSLKIDGNSIGFKFIAHTKSLNLNHEDRKALHLVPFQKEMNARRIALKNLKKGQYSILINEEAIGRWWEDELDAGIDIALIRNSPIYKLQEKSEDIKSTVFKFDIRPIALSTIGDERLKQFNLRNEGEVKVKACQSLVDLLMLTPAEWRKTDFAHRPLLKEVSQTKNDPVKAVENFQIYLFDKVRNPEKYGLFPQLLKTKEGYASLHNFDKDIARAEELLLGRIDNKFEPMMPGQVNFFKEKLTNFGSRNPWNVNMFKPLVVAYVQTGHRKYLDKWFEYLDDWAMFQESDLEVQPTDITDNDSMSCRQIQEFYQAVSAMALVQPNKAPIYFPPATLARILTRLHKIYMPMAILYYESNPQNWTPGAMAEVCSFAMLMDEFKGSEYLFRRALSRYENWTSLQFLPDGTETEHDIGYNNMYYNHGYSALENMIKAISGIPDWQKTTSMIELNHYEWMKNQREYLEARERYFVQCLTPQQEAILGNRGHKRKVLFEYEHIIKEAMKFSKPDIGAVYRTLTGQDMGQKPDFTSSFFAYGGYHQMRMGWDPESGYGSFFCSPFPCGAGGLRGLKNNNAFYLSLRGEDLLDGGMVGPYSFDRSPLRVDGFEQNFNAGISRGGLGKSHKGFSVAYVNPEPANWRYHSSKAFQFAEGNYAGPFGPYIDDHHDNLPNSPDSLADFASKAFNDVDHHRQVINVGNSGIWIITDRLFSPRDHEYELQWYLPLKPNKEIGGVSLNKFNQKSFNEDDIKIDSQRQTISTERKDGTNVTLHQIGNSLKYNSHRENGENLINDYTFRYKMWDFMRVTGKWQGKNVDSNISLIEARSGLSSLLSKNDIVNNDKILGFHALTKNGLTIDYLCSRVEDAELNLARINIIGTTLYAVEKNNELSGLVLGAQKFMLDGKNCKVDQPDFEFSVIGDRLSITPIYRPISPVIINPPSNVFVNKATLHLSTKTKNVEIRYTLDGNDPKVESNLYTGPFEVDKKVTVKAIAMRKELKKIPSTLDGTLATVVAKAVIQPQELLPPLKLLNPKQGFSVSYAEGDWQDLILMNPNIIESPSSIGSELFEGCQLNQEKYLRWTYVSNFYAPESGVYTFSAPLEMVTSQQEPGYALRLFCGKEKTMGKFFGGLNEWRPSNACHGYGTWSIALEKGYHPFKVIFVDYRKDAVERWNHPGMRVPMMWDGRFPKIQLTNPSGVQEPLTGKYLFVDNPN